MTDAKPKLRELGRVANVDMLSLKRDGFIWDRFRVAQAPHIVAGVVSVIAQDVKQELGDAPTHRVEIHELPQPKSPARRESLIAALSFETPLQSHTLAIAQSPTKLMVVSSPAAGMPLDLALSATGTTDGGMSKELAERDFLQLSTTVVNLLSRLHGVGFAGVRFHREQILCEDGNYTLGGFAHLLPDPRPLGEDLDELVAFLRGLGGTSAKHIPEHPTSVHELQEKLHASLGVSSNSDFELSPDPPFVGREDVLSQLQSGVAQAQIATPTALVIKGPRGVGKSRLLREFVATRLEADDVLVLTGSWQSKSGDSRSGLQLALEQLSRVLPRFELDEQDDIRFRINRAARHLGAIVKRSAPTLGGVLRRAEELPQLELGGDFSRHTAIIADVFKALGTRQRPLLLVLDNVEDIDVNSATVLNIITQSRPAHYTFVVMGARTEPYSPLELSFQHEPVELEPLSLDEVHTMLRRSFEDRVEDSEALAKLLLDTSRGLPLALSATMRSWFARGLISRGADGNWRGRKSLREQLNNEPGPRDIFTNRLESLTPETREFALNCAVIGTELDHELLTLVDDGFAPLVKELNERGVLAQTKDGGVRFPHDIIRELVLEHVDAEQRRLAHRRAAALLERHGAPISQIVYHRDNGIEPDAAPDSYDKLSRLHVEAGRNRLDVYDLERARWHLQRALDHSHDAEQRSLAAEGLADVCLLQDDLPDAVALYTALIATSEPADAVRVSAKAVQFLFSKSANSDAKQLGLMALEMAKEPTPTTPFGKLYVLAKSLLASWLGMECKLDVVLRESLCRLYMYMLYIGLIDDPISVPMYAARSHWIAVGLEVGAAAISRSQEAAILAGIGFSSAADRTFALTNEIAQKTNDAWAQGMVFFSWGGALLGLDRYNEGQDRLDDAIAAFRETGDVSIALVAMFYKGLYGRDREGADTILSLIDEGLTTARRNNKRSGVPPLQALKLYVLARQGHPELNERLETFAKALEQDEMPGIERISCHTFLAHAALEYSMLELAGTQVKIAQAIAEEMGETVPEFCHEVHLVASLYRLEVPLTTRAERKALRRSVRKFRSKLKNSPRLVVYGHMLDIKLAMAKKNDAKIKEHASIIVRTFAEHENLHAMRHAHRALAQLYKADEIRAAREHELLARNFGRRLGLSDEVLLSDFTELGRELGMVALIDESNFQIERSREGSSVSPAGMLTSAVVAPEPVKSQEQLFDEESDVLEAWALTATAPMSVALGSLIEPIREAVKNTFRSGSLELECSDPAEEVPVPMSDLQLLLINMLQSTPDAVGAGVRAKVTLSVIHLSKPDELSREKLTTPGKYLSARVDARGEGTQIPVLTAFSNCESLAQAIGGVLSASTSRGQVTLHAHILIDQQSEPLTHSSASGKRIVIVHQDATIRETLSASLTQLGARWQVMDAGEIGPAALDGVDMVFADQTTLLDLTVFAPLMNVRLVMLFGRGTSAVESDEYAQLQVPFALSELEEIISG